MSEEPHGAPGRPPDRPPFRHERERHGLVGPFTGRQLSFALVVVLSATAALLIATAPIASVDDASQLPDPRATQYAIASPVEGLRVGDRPPELSLIGPDGTVVSVTDLAGQPVSLAALQGKVVWIDFWASWCPPCQAETPILRELAQIYRDRGLVILAISVQESTADDVRAYADRYGLSYAIVADLSGQIFRQYRVYGLPTQFFLDRDGVIRSVVQGPVDRDAAAALLERLLGRGDAP